MLVSEYTQTRPERFLYLALYGWSHCYNYSWFLQLIHEFYIKEHQLGGIFYASSKWIDVNLLSWDTTLLLGGHPQIYRGDSRPCILPRVMASSAMGLKLEVFGVLLITHAKNKCKANASMIFARRAAFYACLSSHSDCCRCTWRTTFILSMKKTQRPPTWAPCWDKNGAGSGISVVYL